jgi:uncharacterized protein YdcH (DUF465 family)
MERSRLTALLIDKNEEYRTLHQQHQDLESRLAVIRRKKYLSATEELEAKQIKKEKLVLKDRMAVIADYYYRSRERRTGDERRLVD